ncbi:hypothetical protein GCM10020219_024480 [Nonomuraea dietziae]
MACRPIRDRRPREVVAAISISGPLSRDDLAAREAELARTVIETADSISIGLVTSAPSHAFAEEPVMNAGSCPTGAVWLPAGC